VRCRQIVDTNLILQRPVARLRRGRPEGIPPVPFHCRASELHVVHAGHETPAILRMGPAAGLRWLRAGCDWARWAVVAGWARVFPRSSVIVVVAGGSRHAGGSNMSRGITLATVGVRLFRSMDDIIPAAVRQQLAGIAAGWRACADVARVLVVDLQKRVFSQLFLCLSRACLGKTIGFIRKWLKRGVSAPSHAPTPLHSSP
jgi:hypothetical protein